VWMDVPSKRKETEYRVNSKQGSQGLDFGTIRKMGEGGGVT